MKNYYLSGVIGIVFSICVGLPTALFAQGILLDQQVIEDLPGTQTSGTLAQTFTVGIDGRLDSIDLRLQTIGNRTFDIRPTDIFGVPVSDDSAVLFSTNLAGTADQPFDFSIDVSSANIEVGTGDQLALVLSPTDATTGILRWASSGSNPYADGSGFFRNDITGEFATFFDTDNSFTTFVNTVPEPSAAILGSVLLGANFIKRRRR